MGSNEVVFPAGNHHASASDKMLSLLAENSGASSLQTASSALFPPVFPPAMAPIFPLLPPAPFQTTTASNPYETGPTWGASNVAQPSWGANSANTTAPTKWIGPSSLQTPSWGATTLASSSDGSSAVSVECQNNNSIHGVVTQQRPPEVGTHQQPQADHQQQQSLTDHQQPFFSQQSHLNSHQQPQFQQTMPNNTIDSSSSAPPATSTTQPLTNAAIVQPHYVPTESYSLTNGPSTKEIDDIIDAVVESSSRGSSGSSVSSADCSIIAAAAAAASIVRDPTASSSTSSTNNSSSLSNEPCVAVGSSSFSLAGSSCPSIPSPAASLTATSPSVASPSSDIAATATTSTDSKPVLSSPRHAKGEKRKKNVSASGSTKKSKNVVTTNESITSSTPASCASVSNELALVPVSTRSTSPSMNNERLADFDDDAFLKHILNDNKPEVTSSSGLSSSTTPSSGVLVPFNSPYTANVTAVNRVPDDSEDGRVGHWTDGSVRPPDPWICCYCGVEFEDHEVLRRHAVTHPEFVANKCFVCGKDFCNGSAVSSHVDLVHRKLRNWKCDLCNKRYYANCDLERHKHHVHLKTPYVCTLCSFVCHEDNSLRNHYFSRHRAKIKFKVPYLPEIAEVILLTDEEVRAKTANAPKAIGPGKAQLALTQQPYNGDGSGGRDGSTSGNNVASSSTAVLPPPSQIQSSPKLNGTNFSSTSSKSSSSAIQTTTSSAPTPDYSSLPPSTGGRRALIGRFSLPKEMTNGHHSTGSNTTSSASSSSLSKSPTAQPSTEKLSQQQHQQSHQQQPKSTPQSHHDSSHQNSSMTQNSLPSSSTQSVGAQLPVKQESSTSLNFPATTGNSKNGAIPISGQPTRHPSRGPVENREASNTNSTSFSSAANNVSSSASSSYSSAPVVVKSEAVPNLLNLHLNPSDHRNRNYFQAAGDLAAGMFPPGAAPTTLPTLPTRPPTHPPPPYHPTPQMALPMSFSSPMPASNPAFIPPVVRVKTEPNHLPPSSGTSSFHGRQHQQLPPPPFSTPPAHSNSHSSLPTTAAPNSDYRQFPGYPLHSTPCAAAATTAAILASASLPPVVKNEPYHLSAFQNSASNTTSTPSLTRPLTSTHLHSQSAERGPLPIPSAPVPPQQHQPLSRPPPSQQHPPPPPATQHHSQYPQSHLPPLSHLPPHPPPQPPPYPQYPPHPPPPPTTSSSKPQNPLMTKTGVVHRPIKIEPNSLPYAIPAHATLNPPPSSQYSPLHALNSILFSSTSQIPTQPAAMPQIPTPQPSTNQAPLPSTAPYFPPPPPSFATTSAQHQPYAPFASRAASNTTSSNSYPGAALAAAASVPIIPYIKPEPVDPAYDSASRQSASKAPSTGVPSKTPVQQRPPQQYPTSAQQVAPQQPPNNARLPADQNKSYDLIKMILYDCMHCGQRYGNQMVVEYHLEKKHSIRTKDYHVTFMCKICDKPFPCESDLDSHLKRYH